MAKTKELYYESSVPRMAFLLARGHKAVSFRWLKGKDGKPVLDMAFEKSPELAMDAMDWKGSEGNALVDRYIYLMNSVADYRRSVANLNPDASRFSLEAINNYVPRYEKN